MYTVEELREGLKKAEAAGDVSAANRIRRAITFSTPVFAPTTKVDDTGAIGNLTRGVGAGVVDTLESAALGLSTLLEENAELKAREKIQSVADVFMPEGGDPDSGLYKFGTGLGSLLTFAVPGGAAAKGAQLLGAGAKAQRVAGLTSAGGIGMGAGAGEASERARAAGATEEERSRAAAFGTLIGATEVAPLGRFMKQLEVPIISDLVDKLGVKNVKGIKDRVRNAVVTGGVEAGQEATAAILQNLNERLGYNPERALLDAGVTEEAIIGGQVGSAVQLFTDLFYRGRKIGEPKPPPEPPKGQQDLFQDELDKAEAERAKIQGAPKPQDLDERKKEQDARDKRKDPQGDMFAQELEEERGRDKQMDLFDEADKKEDATKKPEAKDDIKQRELFSDNLAKELDEAVDPKIQAGKPKLAPPVMVGTAAGEVGSQQEIEERTKREAKEREATLGDKPKDTVIDKRQEDEAKRIEADARETLAKEDAQVDAFSTQLLAARRSAKPDDEIITKEFLDQIGLSPNSKLRKILIGVPVNNPDVQKALSETKVRDPAVRARLNQALGATTDTTVSKKVLDNLGVPKDAAVRTEVQGEKLSDVRDTLLTYARRQGQKGLTTESRNKIISFAEGAPLEQGTLDLRGGRKRNVPAQETGTDTGITAQTEKVGGGVSIRDNQRGLGVGEGIKALKKRDQVTETKTDRMETTERGTPTTPRRKRKLDATVKPPSAIGQALQKAQEGVQQKRERGQLITKFESAFDPSTPVDPLTREDKDKLNNIKQSTGLANVTRAKKKGKGQERAAQIYLKKYDNPSSALLAAVEESIRGKPGMDTAAEKKLFKDTDKKTASDFVKWSKKNLDTKTKEWIEKQEAAVKKQRTEKDDERASDMRDLQTLIQRKETETARKLAKKIAGRDKKLLGQLEKEIADVKIKEEETKIIEGKLKEDLSAAEDSLVFDGVIDQLNVQGQSARDVAEAIVSLNVSLDGDMYDPSANREVNEFANETIEIKDNDLKGALETVINSTKNPRFKAIARKLLTYVGDTKIVVADPNANKNSVAYAGEQMLTYFTDTDQKDFSKRPSGMFIPAGFSTNMKNDKNISKYDGVINNYIVLDPSKGMTVHTLLHEATHMATMATLLDSNNITTRQLNALYESVKDQLGTVYGATDLGEFVAEAFGNPEFRASLDKLYPNGTPVSAFQKFKNIIRNFLRRLLGKPNLNINSTFLETETKKGVTAGDLADSLIEKILSPDNANYYGSPLAQRANNPEAIKNILDKMGNVQRAIEKFASKGELRRQLYDFLTQTVPQAPKNFLAFIMPSEVLAEAATVTDKRLGRAATELDEAMRKMRGLADERNKDVSSSIDDLQKWYNTATKEQIDLFNSVVHESTINRVDPTDKITEYTSAQDKENYKRIKSLFDQLPASGKTQYIKMRDSYEKLYEELKKVIERRIDAMVGKDPDTAAQLKKDIFGKLFDKRRIRPYFPLTREGDYKLGYNLKSDADGDVFVFKMFKTNLERKQYIEKEIKNNPNVLTDKAGNPILETREGDAPMKFTGAPPTSFVSQTMKYLQDSKVDPKVINTFMQSFIQALPEASFAKGFQTRENVPGFEPDAFTSFKNKAPVLARQIERMRGAVEIQRISDVIEELQAPKLDTDFVKTLEAKGFRAATAEQLKISFDTLKKELQERAEFALNPPNNFWESVARESNRLAFTYTIGFNVSGAMVNLSQMPLVVGPYLTAEYGAGATTRAMATASTILGSSGSVRDSLMASSNSMFGTEFKPKASGRRRTLAGDEVDTYQINSLDNYFVLGKDGQYQLRDDIKIPEGEKGVQFKKELETLQPLVQIAAEQGYLNSSFVSDTQNVDYTGRTGRDVRGILDFVSKTSAFMFHHVEQFNRQMTMLTAYKLELDRLEGKTYKGLKLENKPTPQELALSTAEKQKIAAQYAIKQTQRLNGGTNLETTGRIGQRGIGRVAMMYKSFGIRMYSSFLASAKRMIDKHEDPLVRKIALRQLIGITGSSVFFAGVRGFPLFGAVMMISNMLLDDDEEDAETIVRKHIGEGWYKGAVTAITGADVSQRIALSGLILQLNRYNPDASIEENIFYYAGGPAFSTAKKIGRGMNDFSEGYIDRGIENVLPAAGANALKALGRYRTEGARTRRGDPIFDDMNGLDLFGQAIGFAPKEYTLQQEQNMQTKKIERVITKERSSLLERLYVARRDGDYEKVSEVMEDIEEFNKKVRSKAPDAKITRETRKRSLDRHRQTSAEMYNGITINPILRDMLEDYREDWDNGLQLF